MLKYQVLALIIILNLNLVSGFFLLDIKKRAIDRLTREVFPYIQKQLSKTIHLPQQKVMGIKIADLELNLDVSQTPIITLQPELNRVLITITNVEARASANLNVRIIKEFTEPTNFYLKLKSIGFGMYLKMSQEDPKKFTTEIEFDHTDLDCGSIDIVFTNSRLNYFLQKLYNIKFLGVTNYLCKKVNKFIKDSAKKLAGLFEKKGLTSEINNFLPLKLPVSRKYFVSMGITDDVQITESSLVIKLSSELQNIDQTDFKKNCREDSFMFFEQVPTSSDFSLQIPDCYVGDFINLLANKDKGIDFPSVQYEFEGRRIDVIAIINESSQHVI